MKQGNIWVRSVAIVLLCAFGSAQVAGAADPRQMLLDAKAFFEEEDTRRPHGLTSADLQAAQASQMTEIETQQALQDLSASSFKLTTAGGDVLKYVGDKLSEVTRPDGTKLANIQADAAGVIVDADLRLADGSVQILQGGKVIGYRTPDGVEVIYQDGVVQRTIDRDGRETFYTYTRDALGAVTETVLDGPTHIAKYGADQKIREATRKADGQKNLYMNGMIDRILQADGTSLIFDRQTVNGSDILVTPRGGASQPSVYTDAAGNAYHFAAGQVSKIVLADHSTLDNIVWNVADEVSDATLTEADGTRHLFRNKQLTNSYDAAGIVTNYSYTASTITAAKAGSTWEYLADGTPVKFTDLSGNTNFYYQAGAYKGLKEREVTFTGTAYLYDYTGSGASIAAQRRELQTTTYAITTLDGQANLAQSSNPVLRFDMNIPADGTIDQAVVVSATYSTTKNLRLNLVAGSGSTLTFNGTASALNVNLAKGVAYKVEMKWESGRIGIYVYNASSAKPSTPTATVVDRAWDPRFKVTATNAAVTHDATSSGYYNRNYEFRDKNYSYSGGSPAVKFDIWPIGASYRLFSLKAVQSTTSSVTRTLTFDQNTSGSWTFRVSDYNTVTKVTTNSAQTLSLPLSTSKVYTAELKIENGRADFYIYEKGLGRPATPTVSLAAFSASTSLSLISSNYLGRGVAVMKNLTAQALSPAHQSTPLTGRVNLLAAGSFRKPAAPPAGTSASDLQSILYDSQGNLKEVLMADASKLLFSSGHLAKAIDPMGNETQFTIQTSALSILLGMSIVRDGLTSTYGADGKLTGIHIGDLTVSYNADGSIGHIEKADGTEIWDMVFDASGVLVDAVILTPDGEERTYKAGKLLGIKRADSSTISFMNDKAYQLMTPEKLIYSFTYQPAVIEATLLQGTALTDARTPVKMEYDLNFNLKKVIRHNQEIIEYTNDAVSRISEVSVAPKVFSYTRDAAGKVLSYTVTQGNVVTTYDVNDQPTGSVISPDASNPDTFDITYQYGKMRQVKKNGAVVFNYSYTFDADGREYAEVDDQIGNSLKRYAGERLVSSLDPGTNVLSTYGYDAVGKVSQVEVSRFGRLMHTYQYRYEGADTLVTDEEGVTRTYDAAQRLVYLEKDGEKTRYTYSMVDAPGPGTTTQSVVLPVGTLDTNYRTPHSDPYQTWLVASSDSSLYSFYNNVEVGYSVNLARAGDLLVEFESRNHSSAIPTSFSYQLDVYVDGVKKTTYNAPASTSYSAQSFTLTGLSAGAHDIRVKWVNHYWNATLGDSNFRFKNLKFTHQYQAQTTAPREIVTEELVEKRLADGSVVRYTAGAVSEIVRPDGRIIRGIVKNAAGEIIEARIYDGAQDTAGTRIEFAAGEITRATTAAGLVMDYSVIKDPAGSLLETRVQKGQTVLRYDANGALVGAKLAGTEDPADAAATTTHTYVGGLPGFEGTKGFDNDFLTTAQMEYRSQSLGGSDSRELVLSSEHTFATNQTVTQVRYRVFIYADGYGSQGGSANANYKIEYLDAAGVWRVIPGAAQTSTNLDTGIRTISAPLSDVKGIRAVTYTYGQGSAGGEIQLKNWIYDIQYQLADTANLSFTRLTDGAGQLTGYKLSGYYGDILFDVAGLAQSAPVRYAALQAELAGALPALITQSFSSADHARIADAMALGDEIISKEYSADGTLETQTLGDGTVTLFENGKPSMVLGGGGEILIQYSYDNAGNPTRVFLKEARDALPDSVAEAQLAIQTQRASALQTLAQQKNLAYQSIQTQSAQNRTALQNALTQLQSDYDSVAGTEARGKAAKSARGDALNAIGAQMDQARVALATSYDQEADAYAGLDGQIKSYSDQIEADTARAVLDLAVQETAMKRQILRQEVSPIVYDAFRRLLGRDPDTAEYDHWIGLIDYNSGSTLAESKTTAGTNLTAALNTYLGGLPELAQRTAYVNTIKAAVTSDVNAYLAKSQAEKEAYAATLGLTAADLVPLSSADSAAILDWINTRSLHFGQSAFLALESMLDQRGIAYTRETLARQAILIDILTGVISPLDDGDLVLSIHSLQKAAGLQGLDVTGAKVTWDSLRAHPMVMAGSLLSTHAAFFPKFIAHLRGDHFVVVKKMTADSVTYIDMGKGADGHNEEVTISKDEFLAVWDGRVVMTEADYQITSVSSQTQTVQPMKLSQAESKQVRGAFLPLLFFAIGEAIANVGAAVWAVANGIGTIIAGIGSFVGGIIDGIGVSLAKLGEGLAYVGKGVYGAVKFAVSTFGKIIGNPFASLSAQSAPAALSTQGFGHALFQTAVKVGLSVATQKGLETIGVNPIVSSLASAFVSGGIAGGYDAGFSAANFIKGGVKAFALQGTQAVLQNAGLDTPLIDLIGTIASPLVDGIQNGNIGSAAVSIMHDLPKNLTFFGVKEAGDILGLSPLVAGLAAAPISNVINLAINEGHQIGQQLIQSLRQAVIAPIIGYATQTVIGQLSIPVKYAEDLLVNVFSRALQNFTSSSTAPKNDFVSILGESIIQAGKNLLLPANLPKLASAVTSLGFARGLESYASEVFERDSIESILASSENLGQYISDRVAQAKPVMINGKDSKMLDLSRDGKILQILYQESPDGLKVVGYYEKGVFYNWSDPSTRTGSVSVFLDNGTKATRFFVDGITERIEFYDKSDRLLMRVNRGEDGALGRVENLVTGASVTFKGGNRIDLAYLGDGGELTHANAVSLTSLSQDKRDELTAMLLGFGNGFNNESAEGSLPEMMSRFIDDLKRDGTIGVNTIFGTTLYEQTSMAKNMWDWSMGAFAGSDVLSNEVEQELNNYWSSLTEEQKQQRLVYFTHSGHFKPLTQVLEHRQDIPIHTVFNFEGPYVGDDVIDNPHLKRLINVNGSAPPKIETTTYLKVESGQLLVDYKEVQTGLVYSRQDINTGEFYVPFLGERSFKGIETYNFEIIGARHSDFAYDPSAYPSEDSGRIAEVREINRRTNLIVRDMYEASLQQSDWIAFLARPDVVLVKSADGSQSYEIDPTKYEVRERQ